MRLARCLFLVPALLLAGCGVESVSYAIAPGQALTLVRENPGPWSSEHRRAMVVMSEPACLVRYRLPPDTGAAGRMEVFLADDGSLVMRDALGQYRANLADCSMALEPKSAGTPGQLKGVFEAGPGGSLRFAARK